MWKLIQARIYNKNGNCGLHGQRYYYPICFTQISFNPVKPNYHEVCLIGLTHWGRVTHICVVERQLRVTWAKVLLSHLLHADFHHFTIIGSDNGLSPVRCQVIIWTIAGLWLTGPLGTNFSEMLIEIHTFSFKKIHLKMSSGKWRLFCLGLNELKVTRALSELMYSHSIVSTVEPILQFQTIGGYSKT